MRFNAIESGLAKLSWPFWYSWLFAAPPATAWRFVPFTSSSKERRRLNHHSVDKPKRLRHIRYIIYNTPKYILFWQTSFGPLSHQARPSLPRSLTPRRSPHHQLAGRISAQENRERMPRDGGFHPFKGRVSRHFGDSVCLFISPSFCALTSRCVAAKWTLCLGNPVGYWRPSSPYERGRDQD